ncbi:MAG TPA: hypothetical protein VNE62_05400 [Actinomycetota bacterium]|nr:hypothetical protein [Actinomycetota bacterium]
MTNRSRRLAPRGEAGQTMVETVAALFIIGIGLVAVIALLLRANTSVGVGKDRNVALTVADSYLEDIRARPYDDITLTSPPTPSTDQNHPNSSVTGTTYRYDPSKPPEPLVLNPARTTGLSPGPLSFPPGPIKGEVYRYVTCVDDAATPDVQDYKRVTVVARWMGGPPAPSKQVKITSVVVPAEAQTPC